MDGNQQTTLAENELKLPLNSPPPSFQGSTPPPTGSSDGSSGFAPAVGLSFLGLNCAVAIYNSRRDPRSVLFVAACFVDVVLLFHLLRVFERLPRGSPERPRVRAAVWALTTALTVMFSRRVAALMPAPVAAAVWAMAAATILAGFVVLFVCRDDDAASAADEKRPAAASKVAEGP